MIFVDFHVFNGLEPINKYIIYIYMYVCMYVCIQRERETERQRDRERESSLVASVQGVQAWI